MIDITTLHHLCVGATNVPSVWRVRMPLWPWKHRDAELERVLLVERLRATFPYQALWLSDWAGDDRRGWHFLDQDEPLASWDDELGMGAWVLFFFERHPGAISSAWRPTDVGIPSSIASDTHQLNAAASIWSWYDDVEWLVVLPQPNRD